MRTEEMASERIRARHRERGMTAEPSEDEKERMRLGVMLFYVFEVLVLAIAWSL